MKLGKPMIAAVALAAICACGKPAIAQQAATIQPPVDTRVKPLLRIDGRVFKDLNLNGRLDGYEDWRLPVDSRSEDLVSRMTVAEKAGMMLIQTLRAGMGGALTENAERLIHQDHMTRFIFRNPVVPDPDPIVQAGFSGVQITPTQAAEFTNAVQELAESTRLGIPVIFKSNARNHYEQDARPGINLAAGSFSTWPKEAGLAATRDMELIREFADAMRQEWTAIGLRGMYGYMADLGTEPRWYRVHETFTEDADLATEIITVLVNTLQGETLGPDSVALTIKHFPGGGPQAGGGDPHYYFGREQTYQSDNFDYHLKPFRAAIDAGVSSIMPYYGVPVDQPFEPNDVGMAFSEGILTGLLRDRLGFRGYVNSDTGIIGQPGANRAWGLENEPVDAQLAIAINAGTDVLSGLDNHALILNLVRDGAVEQARVDVSVRRLLREQFELGLFENPYVDPALVDQVMGSAEIHTKADLAQRKSIVLLQNSNGLLPLELPTKERPIGVYTLGMDAEAVRSLGYEVTAGDTAPDAPAIAIAESVRYALIRVTVSNRVLPLQDYPTEPRPIPGVEPSTFFGGALPDELDFLSFSRMAASRSWEISPPLPVIQSAMEEIGASNVVMSIYFRQPYVLDEESGIGDAGALLALFGADDRALLDVLTGRFTQTGKLPFALANSAQAILRQASDAPGYAPEDVLYPYGFGISL